MREKDIYGNYVRRTNANFTSEIKELTGEPRGYSAVIRFTTGNPELICEYDGRKIRCAADGYKWLMILPLDKHWCVTAMYDADGGIIEWYFDISKRNYINESGIPCVDDLYLDLVVFPDGSIVMLDEDELLEALHGGEITQADYDFAHRIYNEIADSEWSDTNFLERCCDAVLSEYD